MKTDLLAIYLPQFHTIRENDEWWGKGFTEWTNVKRGKKYYPGHYQPREPLHDHYYDLSDLKELERHTKMAKKAGIKGFCFYHYYFSGKKLLEKPIEAYRDKSKETFPYCLIWANQSWERTWYGNRNVSSILQAQTYGNYKNWEEQFNYLLTFFKDERYIKINNKPVYIIYLPQQINCRKEMFKLWQKLAKENGFAGIYLIAMNTGYGADNKTYLYDAFMNFEPMNLLKNSHNIRSIIQNIKLKNKNKISNSNRLLNYFIAQNAYSYSYLCRRIERDIPQSKKTYAGIFAGWDNTPRKDENGIIIKGSSPGRFCKNIRKMLIKSEKLKLEFLFLNAWNEWSEGAYVEPDKKYGYAYLKAIKEAVKQSEKYKDLS